MEINNLEGRSRGSSFRRRALTLVGASALTLSGVGAAVFGASQAFAATGASINVSTFDLGTSVSNVTFASNDVTGGVGSVVYTVGFKSTGGIAANGTIDLTNYPATAGPTSGLLTDTTTGQTQSVTISGGGTSTVTLSVSNAISAGDAVSVSLLGNTNPNVSASPISLDVATSTDLNPVSSNTVTLTAGTQSTSTLSSKVVSASTTLYANTAVTGQAVIAGSDYLLVSDSSPYAVSPSETGSFPGTASSYTVTDTTSHVSAVVTGGVTVPAAVGVTSDGSLAKYAYFLSPISAALNDNIVITVNGFVNDGTAQAQTLQAVNLGTSVSGINTTGVVAGTSKVAATETSPQYVLAASTPTDSYWAVAGTTTNAATGTYIAPTTTPVDVTLGTAVTGFSVSLSNPVASGSSNYSLSFTASTNTANAGTITVTGFTPGAGVTLLNNTTSTYIPVTVSSSTFTLGSTSALIKGDSYTLVSSGVTNISSAGTDTITLVTSTDTQAASTTVTLTPASTVGPYVSVSNVNVGQASTWTINGFEATVTYVGGTDTIAIYGGGSLFPVGASNYTITDLTNSSGSGVASTVTGGNTNTATITLPNNIASGDSLQIVITNVANNSTAGPQSNLTLTGSATVASSGSTTLKGIAAVSAPATTAPNAASTMASGSLVQSGGTIYVVSGGVAFGIPTFSDYQTISNGLGNPAVVQSSTAPVTTGTVASGTLVQVIGSPQINVVGSNNTYYGFSSVSQFESDGYSFANVIQIPSLGSLTAGSGAAPSAASTLASGSLVQTGGTIYVIAGGVAFGIPTFSDYQTISAALGNPMVVQSSTAPSTTGTMASGTLVQTVGSPQINVVTSTGTQVGFSTASEFTSDGYSFAKVILIP